MGVETTARSAAAPPATPAARRIIASPHAARPGFLPRSYTIVAPLGTGGMGEVYRAHDPRLGRDVALNVLPAEMASDPSRLERFTRQARAIAALNHPHIVTIYSTEEADGIRFLTMELVEGQPLDALIPANGMPLARFLELALPLADALNAGARSHRAWRPVSGFGRSPDSSCFCTCRSSS